MHIRRVLDELDQKRRLAMCACVFFFEGKRSMNVVASTCTYTKSERERVSMLFLSFDDALTYIRGMHGVDGMCAPRNTFSVRTA